MMNVMNAPLELCEQVKERFLQFLNGFVLSDSLDAEPSQSITHSQGSGGAMVGRALAGGPWRAIAAAHHPIKHAHGCWGAGGRRGGPCRTPDI